MDNLTINIKIMFKFFEVVKDRGDVYLLECLETDMRQWVDEEGLVNNIMRNLNKPTYANRLKQHFHFKTQCIVFTAFMRYIQQRPDWFKQHLIDIYESYHSTDDTDCRALKLAQYFKSFNIIIDYIQSYELMGENFTLQFANIHCMYEDNEDGLYFGSQLNEECRFDEYFAINIGVEKSRIKTLKRQAEIQKQREIDRIAEQELLKALEDAKPVKVSQQQKTKTANKKKEQEKKEREEFERKVAEAEAERIRQQRKKQQQKQAKKK
jgi:hypothetical protein